MEKSCVEEKKLAFGDYFGKKGLIAPSYFPIFYLVYHPMESIEERRAAGVIDNLTWDIWKKKELHSVRMI